MKEIFIFLFLFLLVFAFSALIFNGRFIYAQLKYRYLGPSPVDLLNPLVKCEESADTTCGQKDKSLQIPQRLIIPYLGVDAPIVWPEDTSETAFQNALERGVVFWPSSSLPEEKGAMVILGHSSAYPWYKGEYGSVFSLLNKLNIGDEIMIFTQEKKYVYRVEGKEIQLPKDLKFEKQDRDSILYLLSCWPVRTDWKRLAIKAIAIDNN